MPVYTYRCIACGAERQEEMSFHEHDVRSPQIHLGCPLAPSGQVASPMDQVLSFHFNRSMPEHFNHSLGQYVTNEADVQSKLSRASDETSARMGFDHKFELVDPSDPASVGVTDKGLDATRAREVADGKKGTQFYG